MNVIAKIKLKNSLSENDVEQMYNTARMVTDDIESIEISTLETDKKSIEALFTITKVVQSDVVDKIGDAFRKNVENNIDITICFPKRKSKTKLTAKQGQYLAFIYYYKKMNGVSPAETDIQKYFKVSPPSVHSMIVKLEENGFISRIPKVPRSIVVLVPESSIPQLL